VDAPGIAGHNVRAFAVSRDGMRFAAVLGHGDQSQLVIAMIKRSVDPKRLTPVSLVGIRDITNSDFPLSNIRGLAWVNPTTIVVLAQDSSSEAQPYEVAVDGSHVQPTSGFLPIGPVSVASDADSRSTQTRVSRSLASSDSTSSTFAQSCPPFSGVHARA
jgi:hypothetical protein